MSTVNPVSTSQYPYNYAQNPQGYYPTQQPGYGTGYTPDAYSGGAAGQGYVQGVYSTAGASSGISSMANSVGGIFNTVTSIVASVLNTVVSFVVNIFKGIFSFCGNLLGLGGDKQTQSVNSTQGAVGPNATSLGPIQQNGQLQPGQAGQIPTPPPGTDTNTAFQIVSGDLSNVTNPNQGIQIVTLHAQKAKDNRVAAEKAAKEAQEAAQDASKLANELQQKRGNAYEVQKTLNEIEIKKSKSLESLKMAEELTKAVYDEALYAQMANDIMFSPQGGKFPQYGQATAATVKDGWNNWVNGTDEKKWLFFNKHNPPVTESFMQAVQVVNGEMNRVNYILGSIK